MKLQEQHVVETEATIGNSIKSVDNKLFDAFKLLTSNEENVRITGSLQLLQHLKNVARDINNDNKEKEILYAVRRMIRGLGASTSASRVGFFTAFVGLLNSDLIDKKLFKKLFSIVDKELHVGGAVANKEDADAIVGQLLTCGALLRANKLSGQSSELIETAVQILLTGSKHKSYHSSMAFAFIIQLLEAVTDDEFKETVWPLLETELNKPWEKQTLNTFQCWIIVSQRFPAIITAEYLTRVVGGPEILNPSSYDAIEKLFWDNTTAPIITQPSFSAFTNYLATSKNLVEFWATRINKCLSGTPTRNKEIITIKILTLIFVNADTQLDTESLLTENVIKMAIASLKSSKTKKDGILKELYNQFFDALDHSFNRLPDDLQKLKIIHKLILHPGTLSIEKFTHRRIIHQMITNLGELGIQNLFETYKKVLLNQLPKNPADDSVLWLNVERQNAGFMIQNLLSQKMVQSSFEWRKEQLKFLMTVSFLHFDKSLNIVQDSEDCQIFNAEFVKQLKNIFYNCLQSKVSKLLSEKDILLSLVEFLNKIVQQKNSSKFFRERPNKNVVNAWNEMYKEVSPVRKKNSKKDNKLQLVFEILLLHMGMQLFREPEMAEAAISDLEKCMEKIQQKSMLSKKKCSDDDNEPEWIEVVIDLFLHLLSQNVSALRSVVNTVFPHLCQNLTLTSVHQILSVLDMSDGKNPLTDRDEEMLDEENDSVENGNGEDATDDEEDTKNVENGDDDEEEDEEEEEEDDEEDLMDEAEGDEGTVTEKLRNTLSTVLAEQSLKVDSDQESLDLDDMNEEEGKRLNEALSAAFKSLKGEKQSKKSKGYRVQTTTVMHFRLRVLDLLEIYIQHDPSLLVSIEILLTLYNMIEFCAEKEFQPLLAKVERVLNKLTSLRNFVTVKDVTVRNICDYLRLIIEKKIKASAFDVSNKLRTKCCIFLITVSVKVIDNSETSIEIEDLFSEYLQDFVRSRNPAISVALLNEIFKMRWLGVWKLAATLAQSGLTDKARPFRRIQITELLDVLYRNHELMRKDLDFAKKSLKEVERIFQSHVMSLAQKSKISSKEFSSVVNVIATANRCHTKIPIQSNFDSTVLCESIQALRMKIKLENLQSYSRFCEIFKLQLIKNSDVNTMNGTVLKNGNVQIDSSNNACHDKDADQSKDRKKKKNVKQGDQKSVEKELSNGNDNTAQNDETNKKKKKRKNSDSADDTKKEKKLKKASRLKTSSEGLNGGLSFAGAPVDIDVEDGSAASDDSD